MCVSKHVDENARRIIFCNSQNLGPTLKLAGVGLSGKHDGR